MKNQIHSARPRSETERKSEIKTYVKISPQITEIWLSDLPIHANNRPNKISPSLSRWAYNILRCKNINPG